MKPRRGTRTRAVPPPRRRGKGEGAPHRNADNAFSLRLPGGPAAASTARQALAHLRGDLDGPLMETARLLVSELVANSVRHASADDLSLLAVVAGPSVWLEVSDDGLGFEVDGAMSKAQSDESGWGLFLVEQLADRWGVQREGDATRVWFELRR
jgi:anti-sigma regulatory factor (Ser/Thr protein kinase)